VIVSLFLYAFVASFTPGPNNIMAMTFANQFGLRKTMRFCLGVGTGFFVIILLCCYFNILLINFIPKIESIMAVIGGVYMDIIWNHGYIYIYSYLSFFLF